MKLGEWKAPSEPSEVGPMKIGQIVLSRSKDFYRKDKLKLMGYFFFWGGKMIISF